MTVAHCKNGHIGPFLYEGDSESVGSAYSLVDQHFVTLTCQSCFVETQKLSVYEVADLLNELVSLPRTLAKER